MKVKVRVKGTEQIQPHDLGCYLALNLLLRGSGVARSFSPRRRCRLGRWPGGPATSRAYKFGYWERRLFRRP